MRYQTTVSSPVGELLLASDGERLTGLWLAGQKYFAETLPEHSAVRGDLPVFVETRRWLDRYFAGENPVPTEIPLGPEGGAYRRGVWELLLEIPYGEVTTYGDIARRLARKAGGSATSARAVGGAVGRNPISILIPCHRVVGADGSLTGYAGGIENKVRLLELEGVDLSTLSSRVRKKPG
jgi:methylated-DNA-[protein]-cysteine S-methyltransferase